MFFKDALKWPLKQGRSVVFPFRCAQEGAWNERRRLEPLKRRVVGACFPRKVLFLGPRKCHLPCIPGGSFINQSMKKRQLFSNFVVYLSTFGTTDRSVYHNPAKEGRLLIFRPFNSFTTQMSTEPSTLNTSWTHKFWPEMTAFHAAVKSSQIRLRTSQEKEENDFKGWKCQVFILQLVDFSPFLFLLFHFVTVVVTAGFWNLIS